LSICEAEEKFSFFNFSQAFLIHQALVLAIWRWRDSSVLQSCLMMVLKNQIFNFLPSAKSFTCKSLPGPFLAAVDLFKDDNNIIKVF